MATANTSDFLGEGVGNPTQWAPQQPRDPNDMPNPNNPGGMSNNDLWRAHDFLTQQSRATGNSNAGAGGGIGSQQAAGAQQSNAPRLTTGTSGQVNAQGYIVTRQTPQELQDRVMKEVQVSNLGINDNRPKGATLGGAASGAALGAKIGGGYGAVIGGAAGGLAGATAEFGARSDQLGATALTDQQLAEQGITNPADIAEYRRLHGYPGSFGTAANPNVNGGAIGKGPLPGGDYYAAPQGGQMATYTPGAGTNGGSALSDEAKRVLAQANDFATQNTASAARAGASATAAGTRAAPQITAPSSANQQAVYDRAMGFQAQSGADAIRAERADVSGAGRLENMQMDMQGVNNLENFQNTQSQQGVNALYGYNPSNTLQSARDLANFQALNTQEGASAVNAFSPTMVQQDASDLRNFKADRSGIDRLNAYADAPEGPSQAQALLRLQSDADKRKILAISQSGRGTPASSVNAMRQAITEGGLISAETRGQGAALRAQETDTYKQRQLAALAQAGSLISQAEAQRLQGMAAAGSLMSAADQQKLQAVMAYGQLKATQDAQELSAKQSSGQLNAAADNMLLGATSNAAALQGDMDQRTLGAIGQAAGLRTQQDSIRSSNLQSAGNIRLQGSEINQRGAIAASSADLQAQALNLQSLSLAGQVSSDIRNQDIQVLRSNLDASIQTLGLNDQQVRFFSQMQNDREVASQNLQMQANALGISATQAQQALDLQWQQFAYGQLSDQQQMQYNYAVLGQNAAQGNATNAINQRTADRADRQEVAGYVGSAFTALSSLFPNQTSGSAANANVTGSQPAGLGSQASPASNYSGYGTLPSNTPAIPDPGYGDTFGI